MQTTISSSTIAPNTVQTLSRSVPAWETMFASMIKNLQIIRRYVPNLVSRFAETAFTMVFFLYLMTFLMLSKLRKKLDYIQKYTDHTTQHFLKLYQAMI